MAANFTKLPELLRRSPPDERGVRWLQPHIHDSPRMSAKWLASSTNGHVRL